MAFDAGAIVGKLLLDKNSWNSTVSSVQKDLEKTKSGFSSMCADLKSNWIATTAMIAAAAITINRAWNLMEMGAKAKQVEDSFMAMAASSGIAGKRLEDSLIQASAYTTNLSNIASSVSTLIGQKLNPTQITTLMQIARVEARKTGEDVSSAFNQMSGAINAGFLRSLKAAYGLNVDATQAVLNYARQTGLTTEQVLLYHKAQAMANEVIRAAVGDLTSLSSAQTTYYERVQQTKSAWNDFLEKLGFGLLNFASMVGDIVGMMFSSIAGTYEMVVSAFYKVLSFVPGLKKVMNEASDALWSKSQENTAKILGLWEDLKDGISVSFGGTRDSGIAMNNAIQQGTEETAAVIKTTFSDWLNDTRQNFNAMLMFGQGSMDALSTGFSDLGMSIVGMGGDIQDAFRNMGNSIIKMLMDIAAKWIAMQAIMGVGKAISSIGSLFSASSGVVNTGYQNMSGHGFVTAYNGASMAGYDTGIEEVPYAGIYKLHAGEQVVPKYDSGKNGVIELTVINQITSGFVNAAIATEPNTVINIINQDAILNRLTRRTQRVTR